MSKTVKEKKPVGYDFWSRRNFGNMCAGYGPIAKWITKRKERMRNKKLIKDALRDPDNYQVRFPGE